MFTGIAFSETIVKPESALRVRGDCSSGSSLYSMLRLRAAVLQVWFRTANTNKHENFNLNHDSEAVLRDPSYIFQSYMYGISKSSLVLALASLITAIRHICQMDCCFVLS